MFLQTVSRVCAATAVTCGGETPSFAGGVLTEACAHSGSGASQRPQRSFLTCHLSSAPRLEQQVTGKSPHQPSPGTHASSLCPLGWECGPEKRDLWGAGRSSGGEGSSASSRGNDLPRKVREGHLDHLPPSLDLQSGGLSPPHCTESKRGGNQRAVSLTH